MNHPVYLLAVAGPDALTHKRDHAGRDGQGGRFEEKCDLSSQPDGRGRIRSAKSFGPAGVAIWAARFEDYRQLGEQWFAFRVALSFPRVNAEVEIDFKTVELNPELPSDVFVLSLPGAVQ